MAAKNVTVIPATISQRTRKSAQAQTRRKVAGYARVSTDSEEQVTSYEAQVDYYTQYIKNNPEWEFIKVYTDEGISGTNTKKREGFNQMVADAVSGKIDLIITKSVSRFARNTVDSLTTVRKLKEKGVEVYFEKENIWTFDGKGELLLKIPLLKRLVDGEVVALVIVKPDLAQCAHLRMGELAAEGIHGSRNIGDVCHLAGMNARGGVNLGIFLGDHLSEALVNEFASLGERQNFAIIAINRRVPTRCPRKIICRTEFYCLNLQ